MLKKILRDRGLRYWLPSYIKQEVMSVFHSRHMNKTCHIMFLICDHYEPKHKTTKEGQDVERVTAWVNRYPELAKKCQKDFGHFPKHSWFYPPHHGIEHLPRLNELAFGGYGELELHYHHDNDTSEKFTRDLASTISDYNEYGVLLGTGDQLGPSFSFIHGDWALDNSGHGKYCGVNDELTILQKAGCWGDFTMPSTEQCQTRKINSIYYAIDDPDKPKSHDTGEDARVGVNNPEGFFMMQGPLGINWRAPRFPKIENSSLTNGNWGRKDRVDYWVRCGIHVKGRPDWIFIKLHTHGAVDRDHDALIGDKAYKMHKYLNESYNDGIKYKLHYVTAREAFNICKAAEMGLDGDPDQYLDYSIKPYASHYYRSAQRHQLIECSNEFLKITMIQPDVETELFLNNQFIKSVSGKIAAIAIDYNNKAVKITTLLSCKVVIQVGDGYRVFDDESIQVTGEGNLYSASVNNGESVLRIGDK